MEKEIWKDVVGYESRYQISNFGNLRSKDLLIKKKDGKTEFREGKVLTLRKNYFGYYYHLMSNGIGKRKNVFVHRMVAEAFIPNIYNKPCVDHINTIRDDNRVCNLRWVTYSENNKNPITMLKYRKVGEYTHSAKTKSKISLANLGREVKKSTKDKLRKLSYPIAQYSKDGVFIRFFNGSSFAQEELGIHKCHINACCNNKRKTAGGFRWIFASEYVKDKILQPIK